MDILDFEFCETPIIRCDTDGRILAKNPAAKRLSPTPRTGSRLILSSPICILPQGRCFVIPFEGSIWLMFCDFLRFDFDGAIFPTAREELMLSASELLKAASEHSALKKNRSAPQVARLRELLYKRFSFIFSAPSDPFRIHSTASLVRAVERVLPRSSVNLSCDNGSTRLINTRNAAILLTSLITILLPYSKGRVKADVRQVGEDLRISLSTLTNLSGDGSPREDLSPLFSLFGEYSADIFAADLCIRACGYNADCSVSHDGEITVNVYVKTEKDLYDLLDPTAKVPFEEELAVLAKKLG